MSLVCQYEREVLVGELNSSSYRRSKFQTLNVNKLKLYQLG